MADSKLSALSAVEPLADTDELYVNNSGVSAKSTLQALQAYVRGREAVRGASVSTPAAGFAADTYLAGSGLVIPSGRLQAQTMYRCKFHVSKTAAGTAAPVVQVRVGTAGTTADGSRASCTMPAQTAVADEGLFEVLATFRAVGSGTSAVVAAVCTLQHRLSVTGLSTGVSPAVAAVGTGFDSSTVTRIGLSVNGGTSAAWTIALVQAELVNLS